MISADRTALQDQYPWLFLRFPHLVRPLVVNNRINKQELLYKGIGEKLRLEIFRLQFTDLREFYSAVDQIHLDVGQYQLPRRCRAYRSDGSELVVIGINAKRKTTYQRCDFDISQLAYVVSTWREPDRANHTSMLVLIEVEH